LTVDVLADDEKKRGAVGNSLVSESGSPEQPASTRPDVSSAKPIRQRRTERFVTKSPIDRPRSISCVGFAAPDNPEIRRPAIHAF
jgi:hypothetical protein